MNKSTQIYHPLVISAGEVLCKFMALEEGHAQYYANDKIKELAGARA